MTKTTSGNVDTYTFTGTHSGTISGAYPNTADLRHIIITVTHGSGGNGDHVQVKIPASMLPLRYYQITNTDNTPKLVVNNAQPISVIYSVGLKDTARNQIASGNFTDTNLAAYVAQNAQDGKIDFYSNKFDKTKTTADGTNKTIGLTTATFTPATSNSYYYHTEDTLLYTKTGEGENANYTPATVVEPNKTYYYKLNYLHLVPPAHTQTVDKTDYVPVSIATQNEINECIITKDGNSYIKKGIKKGSLPSAIDNQLGDKEQNKTGTADRRIDFQWNLGANKGVLYLGNNGKLTMNAKGGLKVTKKVEYADGLNPNLNTEFTMRFTLTGSNLDTNAEYTVTGIEGTQKIKSGDIFKLKADQTAEIVGLPAGSTYTITEENLPAGYTNSITNGTGTVTAGTAQEVTVTNTYEPTAIEVKPTDTDYPFKGEKILKGRAWKGTDRFTFRLVAVNGAPLPGGVGHIEREVTGSNGAEGTSVSFNFGNVTFTQPGTYIYNITEVDPAENKIPGVSYDSSYYRVTVTITDDGSGKLKMESAGIEHIFGDDTATNAQNVTFTNTFENDTETLIIQATKAYKDQQGDSMALTNGQFHFKLEAATVDETNAQLTGNANIPMPGNAADTVNNAVGEITFGDITYTLANDHGKTYYYLLTEINDNKANITYSQEQYLIKAEVSAEGTEAEPLTVTTTYYKWNGNQWDEVTARNVTFTNKFTGTAEATLGVSKSISGRDWKDGEGFTFTLTAHDNAPMPTGNGAAATATKDAPTADFGTITYKKAGTYTYTIKETSAHANGMTNAADVTATVTVALDTESNQLKATVAYSNTENEKAKFVNNLARIDQELCIACEQCANECPVKAIHIPNIR